MKQLSESSAAHEFGSELLKDLFFIKKHKRYPFKRMTLMPLAASGIMLVALILFLARMLPFANSSYKHATSYIVFTLMVVPVIIACKRYVDIIRFYTVKTSFYLLENRKLLQQFFESQHFAFFNHPDAPEIFMMLSKNISTAGDEREVAVFIADDKQILINSHFAASRKKFNFMTAPTHHAQLINMLCKYVKNHVAGENVIAKY